MNLQSYVAATKDLFDEDQKIGTLRAVRRSCLDAGNLPLYMTATARLRYWENVTSDSPPLDAVYVAETVLEDPSLEELTKAIVLASRSCMLASFQRTAAFQAPVILRQLGVALGQPLTEVGDLKAIKVNGFLNGLKLALGSDFASPQHAIEAAANTTSCEVPEAVAYNAVGLINELTAPSELDYAYEMLVSVLSNVDPTWNRGQLFAGENRIQSYLSDGDARHLQEAQGHYLKVLANTGQGVAVDVSNAEGLEQFRKQIGRTSNPAIAGYSLTMLSRIAEATAATGNPGPEHFFKLNTRTGEPLR